MGQTLTNGIYLPNEGERNCYSGLAANWNAVDTLKGNYSLHAINVDIHVTAAEKETWNGKADASALTAHTGDTTIHVTSADKQAWDGHVADTTIHVTSADKQAWNGHVADSVKHVTAEDKAKWDAVTSKANDTDVLHKSGNETKNGELTVNKIITNNLVSATGNVAIQSSGSNRSVAMYNGSSAGDGAGFWAYGKDHANGSSCRLQIYNAAKSRYERIDLVNSAWLPTPTKELDCGSASNKYKSFNGVAPGLMSFPDISAGVDISGYISVTSGQTILSTYTAPADGWISINLGRSSGSIGLIISNGSYSISARENTFPDNHRECPVIMPVFKNDTVTILSCMAGSVLWAYFYPCMGNL